MNDELTAPNVHLQRERFDDLRKVHGRSFLYQNRIKTDLIEPAWVVG